MDALFEISHVHSPAFWLFNSHFLLNRLKSYFSYKPPLSAQPLTPTVGHHQVKELLSFGAFLHNLEYGPLFSTHYIMLQI